MPRSFHGKRTICSTNGIRTGHPHFQKNEVQPYFTLYTKINSKRITNLILRAKTLKLLGGKKGVNLHYFRFGKGYLDTAKHKPQNKYNSDSIKICNFCASKDINKKVKR